MTDSARGDMLILTCEHAGNRVPERYRPLFAGSEDLLDSHEGYDAGALELASEMRDALAVRLIAHEVTRLLVETNRTEGNPQRFSSITRDLPGEVRIEIDNEHYWPHWRAVEQAVREVIDRGERAIQLGVHSFTPVLGGEERVTDVGFLFDASRAAESAFCSVWRERLREKQPDLVIEFNKPYEGSSDGMTTEFRRRFAPEAYLGIELEVSQRFVGAGPAWTALKRGLVESLAETLEDAPRRARAEDDLVAIRERHADDLFPR